MSALSIQPTYPIFTDIDGQPLEAGYVWIGQANLDPQVNPINVYWDAALTIAAPQPIRTLAGYPSRNGTPARLYVNSDYSIRVMNKNGSTVYSAPEATERYGNVITLANLNFLQNGAGAVTRTALSKMQESVSVKDFGAVGDGVTNDTTAIQDAIDSVATAGGAVYFPPGEYLISGSITISTYGVSLIGASGAALWDGLTTVNDGGAIILKSAAMAADAIVVTGGKFTMQDISLVGQNGNTGDGVYLKDAQSCVLLNVCVARMGGNGIRIGTKSGSVGNCNAWQLTNVTSQYNSQHGVVIHDESTTVPIDGPNANAGTATGLNVAGNSGAGLRIINGQFNTFVGLLSQQNSGYGVALFGTSTISLYTTFVGGDVDANGDGNWFISGDAKHIVLSGAFPNLPGIADLDPSINFAGTYTSSGTTTRSIRFDKDQNQLDYYETGTWTPVLQGNDIDPTSVTYDPSRYGTYTRIGNVVHIQGYMRTDAVTVGPMATYVVIAGLPFSPNVSAAVDVADSEGWSTNNPCAGRILAGDPRAFLLFRATANGATDRLPVAAVATGTDSNIVRFSASYFVA